ncbi:MAG: hypothetical protein AAF810_24660, partial [Cyanobacteria bacterium P01_D01_bin.36]
VIAYLSAPLSEYGRKVKSLTLTPMATVPADAQMEVVSCHVPCQINKPSLVEFEVCSVLKMQLIDIGKYRREQVLDLRDWAKEKLGGKMLRTALFGKDYLEVVLEFDTIEETIQRKMTAAASEIGYVLHEVDIQPDLEPFRLAQPFDLVLKNKVFPLSESHTTAALDLTLCLFLSDLEAISSLLSPDVCLEPLIAEAVAEEVSAVLSAVAPDTFRRWLSASEHAASENNETKLPNDAFTVEDALMPCVHTLLESQFKADVKSIVVTRSEVELP